MTAKTYQLVLTLLAMLPIPSIAVPARDKANLIRGEERLRERRIGSNENLNRIVAGLREKGLISEDLKNAIPPEPSHRS